MGKQWVSWLLAGLLWTTGAAAEGYQDGVYEDAAEGYNDRIHVTVSIRDGKITDVQAAMGSGGAVNEYTQKAIDALGPAIVERNGVDGVEAVSGATGSSNTILEAMGGVLKQAAVGAPGGTAGGTTGGTAGGTTGGAAGGATGGTAAEPTVAPVPTIDPATAEQFLGLGGTTNFRVGPGKDESGNQVYSFNVVMAAVLFDRDDRIVDAYVDIYEVATPNYDGESMPRFGGWPGGDVSEESVAEQLSGWVTKRERGDRYGMNPANDWYQQMNAYQYWMRGKTVAELRAWFDKSTTAAGRPIKATTENADDQAALNALTDEERAQLADVVSMATMSLSDAHGLILEAIEKAYENRVPTP